MYCVKNIYCKIGFFKSTILFQPSPGGLCVPVPPRPHPQPPPLCPSRGIRPADTRDYVEGQRAGSERRRGREQASFIEGRLIRNVVLMTSFLLGPDSGGPTLPGLRPEEEEGGCSLPPLLPLSSTAPRRTSSGFQRSGFYSFFQSYFREMAGFYTGGEEGGRAPPPPTAATPTEATTGGGGGPKRTQWKRET